MLVFVILLILVCIGFPLFYVWRIWQLDEPAIMPWLLQTTEATLIVTLIMLVGRWDVAGYFVLLLLSALLVLAIVGSFLRHVRRPWTTSAPSRFWRRRWSTLLALAALVPALGYLVAGLRAPPHTQDLAFPLRHGWFMVGQGGGVLLLNRHASHEAQRFAVDVTAIGPLGVRATGLLPSDLDRYEIFGKEVVSPCNGTAREVTDGRPDLAPPAADREHPAGNHVVLACKGLHVVLAHLKRHSVAVRAGQQVAVGDVLGRVGNSGNTTEPHLHVHAVDPRTGQGVPVSFDGRFPFRNRRYVN